MESLPTFIGRREELQSISVAVRECGEQREPRYVLIEGPPGIGKTTLLNQAVAMMSESRRVNIYLDADDRGRAGFAARRLLRKPHRNRARQDREGLQARIQAAADSIEAPIVVAVEDFHWVDTMSADIFFDVIRDMEPVPMFNPVTMRSSDRADLRRFSRLAGTKAEAVHCVLAPFTAKEIREILREATDLPVGMAVARRVQEATDGFPQFVAAVVAWLQAAPPGEGRNIEQAIASIHAPQGPAEAYQQVVANVLDEYGPTTRRVIALLALTVEPMAFAQIARALDIPQVDVDELFDTALVTTVSGRARLRYGITARAVQSLLIPAERADLHQRLADRGSTRRDVLLHLAELAQLAATSPVTDELVTELITVCRDALDRQDLPTAVTFARAAFRLRPEEPTAALLTRTAVKARRTDLLVDHHSLLELLPHGMARSAALVRIHVEAGRADEAFHELDSAGAMHPGDTDVLLVFAEALADLSTIAVLRGLLGRAVDLLGRTDELLREHETMLDGDPRVAARRLPSAAVDLTNVRALLRMWRAIAEEGPGILTDPGSWFSKDLATLESIPGTTSARAVMLAARGPEWRRTGYRPGALADLGFVDNHAEWVHPAIAVYGRAQLAYARFDAGLWDAAFSVGNRAASEALLSSEGAPATVAYAAAALVPHARGDAGSYRALLDVVDAVPESHSPTGGASRHYVLAWEAIGAGDHDRAREELSALHHSGQWWRDVVTSWVLLVRASVFSGRPQGVEAALQEAEASRTATEDVRRYACEHIRGLSELGVGRTEAALEHLRQALAIISDLPPATGAMPHGEGGGLRIFRALLAMDIAQAVTQQSAPCAEHREQAEELISWAEAVWVACGATGLARQTRWAAERLRRPAGPSRAAPGEAADGDLARTLSLEGRRALSELTDRERQIALMVADGRTNRDVAQELFLSVRTVEYHVANALSKLTLRSKRDLQRLLVSSGWGATN